ncbi:metallophosphoesterase family protein [Dissulfurirhabdus thermomarina]|uniref:Metallophosphoesterase family protein n=1 Tax=Dissulfurirhabdus thermomarina TaxID=1765737 RepID=A0A6N9TNG4_DISTH|nr:metallophosphoesterase family protein [Dissulfurirhabdus thermomarina]NDY42689.1 metallophosphoesterase family protein [Dissulfurirhabdus thermomarina]NMX24093.1 metallophosphoesterase family protein [Dissulfurirhabdus thermomarina]
MRLAVLSDIHGNLEAFRAVLADVAAAGADRAVCLGDIVGYGADPEACVALVRERGIACIQGNHDLGVVSPAQARRFNPSARVSLEITKRLLSPGARDFLAALPRTLVVGDAWCVHGFPPDSVDTYLWQATGREIAEALRALPVPLCFVGHTHELALVRVGPGDVVVQSGFGPGGLILGPGERVLVNAGSVGQPRDGDSRAKYVVWDDAARTLEVRRVPYDVAAAAEKILAAGFPAYNAQRLGAPR